MNTHDDTAQNPRTRMQHGLCFLFVSVFLAAGFAAPTVGAWELPSLDDIDPRKKKNDDKPSALPGLGVCAVLGFGAAKIAQRFAEKDAQLKGLSPDETDKRVKGYMIGFGLLGCVIGKKVTDRIVQNMSDNAKKERELAWAEAQNGVKPVTWEDTGTGYSGTEEIIEITTTKGRECGVRRSLIKSGNEETEAFQKQCRESGSGDPFQPVAGLG